MKNSLLILIMIFLLACEKKEPMDPLKNQFWLYVLMQQPVNVCPQNATILDAGTHSIPLKQNEAYYFDIKPRLDPANGSGLYTITIVEQAGQDVKYTDLKGCITTFANRYTWDGGPFYGNSATGKTEYISPDYNAHIPEKGYLIGIKLMTSDSNVSVTIPSGPTLK